MIQHRACSYRIISCAGRLALALLLIGMPLRAVDEKPEPPPVDTNTSPYHIALLAYKSAKYDDALTAINQAEKDKPGDVAIEILKARILLEKGDYAGADASLQPILKAGGAHLLDAQLAAGDLNLRRRSFDKAAKFYDLCLQAKSGDPDITLKKIYACIGAGNYIDAGKAFSKLKPLDSKNPSYYFAKAALAKSTGKSAEADEAIEDVRTVYGLTVTNHYLKTYLEVMEAPEAAASPASRAEPPPASSTAPANPAKP